MKKFITSLIIILFPFSVFSQTPVSGNQTGTWTSANSPYLVIGDIEVPAGQMLVINPGVVVKFHGYYKFVVNGKLQAVGNANDSIYFTTDNPAVGWKGIRFINADTSSILSYCVIRYGKSTGSWPDNSGGGVSLWLSSINIEHCYIADNFSDYFGGGLFCWSCEPKISYTVFRNDSCTYNGGAIHLYFSDAIIKQCEIIENGSYYYGAGLCCEFSNPEVSYCLFANNNSFAEAGAMYFTYSNAILSSCTFSRNVSTWGMGGAIFVVQGRVIVTNSIAWNNTGSGGDIYLDVGATAVVNYCDLPGSWGGTGNINTNPLFVNAAGGDFHLSQNSPCINTGTAFFVYSGDTIINLNPGQYYGNAPDMGAFEYTRSVGIKNFSSEFTNAFYLYQNYPNPFNPKTTINYRLPYSTNVMLEIYNLLGEKIKTLVNDYQTSGYKSVVWDGLDGKRENVSSGFYIYRLTAGESIHSRKMLLLE